MAPIALLFGLALGALGYVGYAMPQYFGQGEANQPTALIPAYFGAALLLTGLISLAGIMANKHAMHIAALVGLLGAAGGIYPLIKGGFDFSKASNVSGAGLVVLSAIFLFLCIRSFIAARKAREAKA